MPATWDWTIGRVVAPFGIRGEMKTEILTDFPERFQALKTVALVLPGRAPCEVTVESSRFHKGRVLLKVSGVNSIDDVENWRGAEVRIAREDAVPLPDGSFYTSDLVGMLVVTTTGNTVGPVEEVLRSPGHDLLRVGEWLIPFVHAIVLKVDTREHRIIVDPPVGLLDGLAGVADTEADD